VTRRNFCVEIAVKISGCSDGAGEWIQQWKALERME
jgi:hypothetical protein